MPADVPAVLSIFTDGSHKKAPGANGLPGIKRGWAAWCRYGGQVYVMSESCDHVDPKESNPTMELRAAASVLEQLFEQFWPANERNLIVRRIKLHADYRQVIEYGDGTLDASRSSAPHYRAQALRLQAIVAKYHRAALLGGPKLEFAHVYAHQQLSDEDRSKPLEGNHAADALAGNPTGENTFSRLFAELSPEKINSQL
jgi:ribonuclease HI